MRRRGAPVLRALAVCALVAFSLPAWADDPLVGGGGSKAVSAATGGDLSALLEAAQPIGAPPTEASDDETLGTRVRPGGPSPWRQISPLLQAEGLRYSALYAGSQALLADPSGAADQLEGLLDLADQLGDEALLTDGLVHALQSDAVQGPLAERAAVVAGKDLLRRSDLGAAREILQRVQRQSPSYPDAQMLLGIVIANQGRAAEALPALLTAESTARNANREADFQTATKLNVARAFYGAGQWAPAASYFAQVPRDSDWWPDAQFERAWAHFRADDMQATLALLKNHDSPFFDAWYYPEADLLRAYALFTLCKFPSVSAEIDAFMERYEPMKAELDRHLGRLSPAQALTDVRALRAEQPTQLPVAVLRHFRVDQRLTDRLNAIDALDAEIAVLQAGGQPWAGQVAGWLTARRDAIEQAEGQRVLDRAGRAATELAEMLQGIEITRVDMLGMETEMYERAAATGRLDFGDPVGKLRQVRRGQRGERVWPFQGEYWADELGYFRVDARSDCPPSLSDGE